MDQKPFAYQRAVAKAKAAQRTYEVSLSADPNEKYGALRLPECPGTYIILWKNEAGIGPVVKIGHSKATIARRVRSLRNTAYGSFPLLFWWEDRNQEVILHRRFDADRVHPRHLQRAELFNLSQEMLAYINIERSKRGLRPVNVEAMTLDYVTDPPTDRDYLKLLLRYLDTGARRGFLEACQALLQTRRFRSLSRKTLRDKLVGWLEQSEPGLPPFTHQEWKYLLGSVRWERDGWWLGSELPKRRKISRR